MHSELPGEVAGPPPVKPIVEFHEVSKWYGNVIGINKLTINIPAGITGLLGPNGAASPPYFNWRQDSYFPARAGSVYLVERYGIALH